jgi:Tol biopolymer transport system component
MLGFAALLILVLVAVAALYAGSQRRLPAPFGPAVNGQIANWSNGDILVRDTLTGTDRVLVGGPEADAYPIYSRQGDRFLFVRNFESPNPIIMVATATGTGIHQVGGEFPGLDTIEWSPSGSEIAVGWESGGVALVSIVETEGGASRTLDLGFPATSPFWRPSTDQLLVRGVAPEGPGFYLIRADGTDLRRLDITSEMSLAGQYDFLDAAWSSDGSSLAYHELDPVAAAPDGNGFRIHVAQVDAAGLVTSDRALEFDPSADDELQARWTPTGDGLVFQRREGATDTIHLGRLDGKLVRTYDGSSTDGGGITMDLSPDGRFVIARYNTPGTLWSFDLGAPTATRVVTQGLSDFPSWQRISR